MTLSRLDVKPLDTQSSFRTKAYHALKEAILGVNVYAHPEAIRLDERRLSQDLGVSRTPIREATIGHANRAQRSIIDHMNIIEALERRDTEAAETLARRHTLDLAAHVELHCDFLD
jgi:DNA-binding GntR family transcriptional regulator